MCNSFQLCVMYLLYSKGDQNNVSWSVYRKKVDLAAGFYFLIYIRWLQQDATDDDISVLQQTVRSKGEPPPQLLLVLREHG